jgi:hypothetical protein
MRANQEEKLKPYVVELENSIKHSLTLLVGLYQVRANQEEKLKPYVVELENSIKQKLDKAKQAKEKQEEMLMEKLAEHTRSVCFIVIPSPVRLESPNSFRQNPFLFFPSVRRSSIIYTVLGLSPLLS